MTSFSQRDNFSTAARVLGALFYYAPDSAEAAPLISALRANGWQTQWPLSDDTLCELVSQFQIEADESLSQARQRLFVGPYALPSPPWGSVWLDRENVLFGESTLALRQWMRDNGIQFDMQQNEPEDHFGSLLLLTARLAENGHHNACEQLLARHLLPVGPFPRSLYRESRSSVLSGPGELARLTLAHWQSQLLIPVAVKPLFR